MRRCGEEVNKTRQQVSLRQVEESVEHKYPGLVKLDELVRVDLVDFSRLKKLKAMAADQDVSIGVNLRRLPY